MKSRRYGTQGKVWSRFDSTAVDRSKSEKKNTPKWEEQPNVYVRPGKSKTNSRPTLVPVSRTSGGPEIPAGELKRSITARTTIEIFPGLDTPVIFKNGEPYITVYRGIKGSLDPDKASEFYGDNIFCTLSKSVSRGYMKSFMGLGMNGTLIRMDLPLKKAYIAKRNSREEDDQLYPVLDNLDFIRNGWNAEVRKDQKELVWRLSELGDTLATLEHNVRIKTFDRTVERCVDSMGYRAIGVHEEEIDSIEHQLHHMANTWRPSDPKEAAVQDQEKAKLEARLVELEKMGYLENARRHLVATWETAKTFFNVNIRPYRPI